MALQNYLGKGYHGKMTYMENHFEKRLNPALLHPGTKSVISLLYNYFTDLKQADKTAPVLSKYAYGKDYHIVLKEKINCLLSFIKKHAEHADGRIFVDSAPVLERAWAQRAGLGWIGKNGNLINKQFGSFFFIGEIFVNIKLDPDGIEMPDYCGNCTRCIDVCPTKAIVAPGIVDARKCISYLTIELKDEIPLVFGGKIENRVFGCDICQDVCPFNKKSKNHKESEFELKKEIIQLTKIQWHQMDEIQFKKLFRNSAVKRTKFEGLKRNLEFLNDSH